jgi:hypothetical protein
MRLRTFQQRHPHTFRTVRVITDAPLPDGARTALVLDRCDCWVGEVWPLQSFLRTTPECQAAIRAELTGGYLLHEAARHAHDA